MKTNTKLALIILGLTFTIACSTDDKIFPSSTITTDERIVENYDGIEVSSAFTVDIEFSDTEELIEIEANKNLQQFIIVEKSNGKLNIKLENNIHIHGGNMVLKAHIITKNPISSVSAKGASLITFVNTLQADIVYFKLTGASSIDGSIESNMLDAEVEGASSLILKGMTTRLNGRLTGASLLSNFDLITNDVDLHLSGASNSSITAKNNIDLVASGASVLRYKGNAIENNINLSGASQIINMD
jgi:hypothetical protein